MEIGRPWKTTGIRVREEMQTEVGVFERAVMEECSNRSERRKGGDNIKGMEKDNHKRIQMIK